jgi:hypothetical protein
MPRTPPVSLGLTSDSTVKLPLPSVGPPPARKRRPVSKPVAAPTPGIGPSAQVADIARWFVPARSKSVPPPFSVNVKRLTRPAPKTASTELTEGADELP